MADPTICSIPNCGKPIKKMGWCGCHYRRYWLYGDPLKGRESPAPMGSLIKWLKDHIGYQFDECLTWPFKRGKQTAPKVWYQGRMQNAARVMCIMAHGEPPTGIFHAAHSCGKSLEGCVNPKHLRWATPIENNADKFIHGTIMRGSKVPHSRLTEAQVIEIKNIKGTMTQTAIARKFNVHVVTISDIYRGATWSWLLPP